MARRFHPEVTSSPALGGGGASVPPPVPAAVSPRRRVLVFASGLACAAAVGLGTLGYLYFRIEAGRPGGGPAQSSSGDVSVEAPADTVAELNWIWKQFRATGGVVLAGDVGAKPAIPDGSKRQRAMMITYTPTYFARAALGLFTRHSGIPERHLVRVDPTTPHPYLRDPGRTLLDLSIPNPRRDATGFLVPAPGQEAKCASFASMWPPWLGYARPVETWFDSYYVDTEEPVFNTLPLIGYLFDRDEFVRVSEDLATELQAANLALIDEWVLAGGQLSRASRPKHLEELAKREGLSVALINGHDSDLGPTLAWALRTGEALVESTDAQVTKRTLP